LAAPEKRTEPTQENITLCYESRVTFPALLLAPRRYHACFDLVALMAADAPRVPSVNRALSADVLQPSRAALGVLHDGKFQRIAEDRSTPLATCRNGNGGHEGNGARNSNATAQSASTPKMPLFCALHSI
jgi:DNA-binding PucR family transcriptional regulator